MLAATESFQIYGNPTNYYSSYLIHPLTVFFFKSAQL